MNSPSLADRRELISFRIGEQEFCVDIRAVREIRGWTLATPLPNTPDYIRGVINLRGAVLPIVDLGARLEIETSAPTERHVIIVVQIDSRTVGLLVEAVSDILTVGEEQIQPAPDVGSDANRAFVRGLIPSEGRLISMISLDGVLPAACQLEEAA